MGNKNIPQNTGTILARCVKDAANTVYGNVKVSLTNEVIS